MRARLFQVLPWSSPDPIADVVNVSVSQQKILAEIREILCIKGQAQMRVFSKCSLMLIIFSYLRPGFSLIPTCHDTAGGPKSTKGNKATKNR